MEALPENDIDSFIQSGIDQTEMFNKLAERSAVLLHQVFVQNEHGAQLLANWKNDLLMIPSILPESSQFGAGLTEAG